MNMSTYIFLNSFKKDDNSTTTFNGYGLVINLYGEHAAHVFSLGKRIYRLFKGCPYEFSIICHTIIDLRCPNRSCQNINIFWLEHLWCVTTFVLIDFMTITNSRRENM